MCRSNTELCHWIYWCTRISALKVIGMPKKWGLLHKVCWFLFLVLMPDWNVCMKQTVQNKVEGRTAFVVRGILQYAGANQHPTRAVTVASEKLKAGRTVQIESEEAWKWQHKLWFEVQVCWQGNTSRCSLCAGTSTLRCRLPNLVFSPFLQCDSLAWASLGVNVSHCSWIQKEIKVEHCLSYQLFSKIWFSQAGRTESGFSVERSFCHRPFSAHLRPGTQSSQNLDTGHFLWNIEKFIVVIFDKSFKFYTRTALYEAKVHHLSLDSSAISFFSRPSSSVLLHCGQMEFWVSFPLDWGQETAVCVCVVQQKIESNLRIWNLFTKRTVRQNTTFGPFSVSSASVTIQDLFQRLMGRRLDEEGEVAYNCGQKHTRMPPEIKLLLLNSQRDRERRKTRSTKFWVRPNKQRIHLSVQSWSSLFQIVFSHVFQAQETALNLSNVDVHFETQTVANPKSRVLNHFVSNPPVNSLLQHYYSNVISSEMMIKFSCDIYILQWCIPRRRWCHVCHCLICGAAFSSNLFLGNFALTFDPGEIITTEITERTNSFQKQQTRAFFWQNVRMTFRCHVVSFRNETPTRNSNQLHLPSGFLSQCKHHSPQKAFRFRRNTGNKLILKRISLFASHVQKPFSVCQILWQKLFFGFCFLGGGVRSLVKVRWTWRQ